MDREARLSNIEFLRIIAMIMIVFHHYATHGGVYWNVYDGANEWISTVMISFGKIGVDIFMIICGYFMIEQKFTWKKLLKLEIPVWFYSVLFGLLACIVWHDEIGIHNVLCFLFPVLTNQGNQYWFVPCYMATILLSPAINMFLKSLDFKVFKKVLLCGVLLISIVPTLFFVNPILDGNISLFILLYMIGAFFRLHGEKIHKINNVVMAIIFLLISTIMIIGTVYLKGISCDILWKDRSPLSLTISILLFQIFEKIPIGYNKWINKVAATTFGVYLIHDNLYVRNHLWGQWLRCGDYYWSDKLWLHGICCVAIVFAVCVLIEWVRSLVFDRILVKEFIHCKSKVIHRM